MRRRACLAVFTALFALALWGNPVRAQQTQAQAYAQQKYNEYLAAHEQTWRAQSQGMQYAQYLEYERAAWNAYTQAQNNANAEANQMWANHYAAQVDTAIASWVNHIRTLYDRRDVNAYATDPNYKTGFDIWVTNWTNYGNHMIGQLSAYRQQLVGNPSPPPPPSFDPRYTGSNNGPISDSYDPSRGHGPLR
jgi:hypothetical protein